MGRDWRVDTLRGYFLVVITLDHLHNPLRRLSHYTFGYAACPDGFHLLSGLVTGWVYTTVADRYGFRSMTGKAYRRAGVIYLTHMTVVVTCALTALYPALTVPKVDQYWRKLAAGAVLNTHQGVERILPLYCMFLAFTPCALWALSKGRAWLVAILSAGLWVLAQFGLGTPHWGLPRLHTVGYFNVYAWQAYFAAGLYLGFCGARYGKSGLLKSRWLQLACATIAMLLLVDRHMHLWGQHPLFQFVAGPNHNPVRFLDAACIAYLVWCVPRSVDVKLMRVGICRYFNFLGRHALQVVAVSLALTAIENELAPGLSGKARLLVALMNIAALWIPARLHELWRESERSGAPVVIFAKAAQASLKTRRLREVPNGQLAAS